MSETMPNVSDAELVMCNTLVIAPEHREEYLDELHKVLPQARALEACTLLEVGEVADRPGTFVLFERWRSGTEYLSQVLALPFYQRYLEASEPFYSGPRQVLVLTPL